MPAVFLLALLLRGGEWLLRRRGVWYDLWGRHSACGGLAGRPAGAKFVAESGATSSAQATSLPHMASRITHRRVLARSTYYLTVAGLGGEPDYEQRFAMWGKDIDKALKSRPIPK